MDLIKINKLSFGYNGTNAITDIDMTVKKR